MNILLCLGSTDLQISMPLLLLFLDPQCNQIFLKFESPLLDPWLYDLLIFRILCCGVLSERGHVWLSRACVMIEVWREKTVVKK